MSKCSIIITSYLPESKSYLELCLSSINNLATKPYEIIIVGRPDYLPKFPNCKTVSPKQDKFAPPVGLNCGISHADPNADYLFVINDDVLVTRNCLDNLLACYQANPAIGLLMPIGNDQQGRYAAATPIPPGPYRYEQLAPHAKALMNADSYYPSALSFHKTLCIYAFLISPAVVHRVGLFNENLIGKDDYDYTMRIYNSGLLNAIQFNSLLFHFGGASSSITFTDEMRAKSEELFKKEWPDFQDS